MSFGVTHFDAVLPQFTYIYVSMVISKKIKKPKFKISHPRCSDFRQIWIQLEPHFCFFDENQGTFNIC